VQVAELKSIICTAGNRRRKVRRYSRKTSQKAGFSKPFPKL